MTLLTLPRTDLLAVARSYAANPDEWPFAPRFDPFERWYARLTTEPDHEVWLLTWLPGQATDLHDHGGSAGAFVVVSGSVVEQTVAGEGLRPGFKAARYETGDGHAFGTHHVHRIANLSERPAVTVHAYGPALRSMTKYRLTGGGLQVQTVEQAGTDW